MKVQRVAFVASSLSGLTLISCLMVIWLITSDVHSIWRQMEAEMNEFRVLTDQIWSDIATLGAKYRHSRSEYTKPEELHYAQLMSNYGAPASRPSPAHPPSSSSASPGANSEHCGCKAGLENSCRGVQGPKGMRGVKGVPGRNGLDGVDGKDAADVDLQRHVNNNILGCYHCPSGPAGTPGVPGKVGTTGMRGAKGQPGIPGRSGNPGQPGEAGPPGPVGHLGASGLPGERGFDFHKPIGVPGRKGSKGAIGEPCPSGRVGNSAPAGTPGPKGPIGLPGPLGGQGRRGEAGAEGPMGKPGRDAHYCQCPQRANGEQDRHHQLDSVSMVGSDFMRVRS